MNFVKVTKKIVFQLTVLLTIPVTTYAQAPTPQQWLANIIDRLVNYVAWPVFVGLVVVMFIWSGFLFLTAHGDPGKTGQATKSLVWAVTGVAVGLLAFSAIVIIKWVLGIP